MVEGGGGRGGNRAGVNFEFRDNNLLNCLVRPVYQTSICV